MFRALIMLAAYVVLAPLAALFMFPWMWITGDVNSLYRVGTWIAKFGVQLAGVRVHMRGMERFDPHGTYIFMSNHISNLDPPLLIPRLPQRTSVLTKASLFRIPILGYAMRKASLVPVDRSQREAAIQSVHEAAAVLRAGISMTVFPEGTRSTTGKLLPFKKGPFYLAEESGIPIVPVTIAHTDKLMPKGRFAIRKGTALITFHSPVLPRDYPQREALMEAVRSAIAAGAHRMSWVYALVSGQN